MHYTSYCISCISEYSQYRINKLYTLNEAYKCPTTLDKTQICRSGISLYGINIHYIFGIGGDQLLRQG